MTPKQFHLLWDRHKEALLHRELVQAYTTAAIYNLLGAPSEPIKETAFMPNLVIVKPAPVQLIPDEVMDDFRARRAHLAALLEAHRNTGIVSPELVKMGLFSKDTNE